MNDAASSAWMEGMLCSAETAREAQAAGERGTAAETADSGCSRDIRGVCNAKRDEDEGPCR
jgi:hypothetical protein